MTGRVLRLAPDLTLPLELVTESVGILAVKRAGKSHTAKKLTEQLHRAGQQVVVVDPKGDWWGLRSSADGKGPGLPVVILGGEHGDVPLEPGAGELVGKLVVEQRVSLVLDLSELRKHQVATFMTAFLETLYRLKAKDQYRTPTMLVIDEADAIAPQRPMKGEERMLGAAEDIVRRGGQRGIGITLVSQRAAVLNKNVLTQVGVLILLRTTGSQDIDAVDEWIKKHGQQAERERVMAGIAQLPRGHGWVWAPGWPTEAGIFRQVTFAQLETFDSGATPKPGQQQARPKTVADVDLVAFRREMAATIERAKQEDPKALRVENAQLRSQLTVAQKTLERRGGVTLLKNVEKRVDVPILKDGQLSRLEAVAGRLERFGQQFSDRTADLTAAVIGTGRDITASLLRLHHPNGGAKAAPAPAARPAPASRPVPVRQVQRSAPTADGDARPLRKGALRMLEAIARRYPAPTTEAQVAQLAGLARTGGTFSTYLSDLRRGGYIHERGDQLELTESGWEAIGQEPGAMAPQSTEEVLALYAGVLRGGARRMIQELIPIYPRKIPRAELAASVNMEESGGTFSTYLSDLRKAGLIDEESQDVGASELLMNPAGAV